MEARGWWCRWGPVAQVGMDQKMAAAGGNVWGFGGALRGEIRDPWGAWSWIMWWPRVLGDQVGGRSGTRSQVPGGRCPLRG